MSIENVTPFQNEEELEVIDMSNEAEDTVTGEEATEEEMHEDDEQDAEEENEDVTDEEMPETDAE